MITRCIFLFCIVQVSLARSAGSNTNEIDESLKKSSQSRSNGISSYMSELKSMYQTYQDCAKDEVSTCLKMKLISSMDKAFRKLENVEILKGVTFEKDPNIETKVQPLKLEKIEESLPRSLAEKESVLNGIILKELVSFLNSHTLKVSVHFKWVKIIFNLNVYLLVLRLNFHQKKTHNAQLTKRVEVKKIKAV